MPTNLKITVLLYAVMTLCRWPLLWGHTLPWPLLSLLVVVCLSRWAFSIHTATHRGQYGWLEGLMPLVMSPLSVGLETQRRLHLQHHAFVGTKADPDWLSYSASWSVSLVRCLLHPEITFVRTMKQMDADEWLGAVLRLALFVVLHVVFGIEFVVWYLLPLRLTFGLAQFVFTNLHRDLEQGTVNLTVPWYLRWLVGRVGVREFREHRLHHGLKN